MQVQHIMHKDVQLADPNMTIRDAARAMRADNIGALPIGENDRLIGMVTDRDIVVRAVADDRSGDTSVRDVMSEGICYCFEEDALLLRGGRREAGRQGHGGTPGAPPSRAQPRRTARGRGWLADIGRSGGKAAQGALKGISEKTEKARR